MCPMAGRRDLEIRRMKEVKVKLIESGVEMEAAREIRVLVFVQEQGCPLEEEFDEHDATAIHAVALIDGRIVGTGRLVQTASGEAQIGRLAVEQEMRRRGAGEQIMAFLEDQARRPGTQQVTLHSQTYIKDFYSKRGYVEEGNLFLEAGIEHIKMRKWF